MFYAVRHVTRFRYSTPIRESVMEVRMHPRTEGNQRCVRFDLSSMPRARVMGYRDAMGNVVHYFDVPSRHAQLTLTAESLVDVQPPPPIPEVLGSDVWADIDALALSADYWDYVCPSHFTEPSPLLHDLISELGVARSDDPLTILRQLNQAIFKSFDYELETTSVDSPIDVALASRRGVCQDFAHIMLALVRQLGIPCRYVSGYLFHRNEDRSEEDASHAWIEVLLPGLGWIGFDPTNNLLAGDRHIRVAIGRDYADVSPSRGVYKGQATSALDVAVRVTLAETPFSEEPLLPPLGWSPPEQPDAEYSSQEQQQQQQQ